jgi:hypothetical protein
VPTICTGARLGPVLALLLAAGCGGGSTGSVSGTVTLGSDPLKEGTITFTPADGKGQTVSAPIKDGKFSASLPVGDMKVQISAPRPTGKKRKMYDTPDSPEVEEMGELVPEKYNTQSTLTLKVKGGSQTETFALDAK